MTNPETPTPSDTFETKLDAILGDNLVAKEELAELRALVSCTSNDEMVRFQGILEKKYLEKKDIKAETKAQLQALLSECQKPAESPEALKTSSFEQVFSEARSEVFSRENIGLLQGMIDRPFEGFNLNPEQKENIRLAMMEKFLQDPEIQKLAGTKLEIVDIMSRLVKGKTKEEKITEESGIVSADTQIEELFKTIKERVGVATKPLADFLGEDQKNTSSPILSNPREIAKYSGGEISPDIRTMERPELGQYIEGLRGNLRAIDNKIFPMEQIKEQGMNFLANAPSIFVEFFKWILQFDFIAKFFGYTGSEAEQGAKLDEELKQRRSLGILREFGRVTDMEGKESTGKYSGKIELLKGKDLSKISRTKLAKFFAFTKEEGVDVETPDFWTGIFNKGQVIGKEKISYSVSEIKASDLEDNYKGLYEKLNKLKAQNDTRKKEEAEKVATTQKEATQKAEAERIAIERRTVETEVAKNEPLKGFLEWSVTENMQALALGITLQDFIDGTFRDKFLTKFRAQKQMRVGNDVEILGYMSTMSSLIKQLVSSGKMDGFKKKYLTNQDTNEVNVSFRALVGKRTEMLVMCGHNPADLWASSAKLATLAKQAEVQKDQAENERICAEIKKERDEALAKMIVGAKGFPIKLNWNADLLKKAGDAGVKTPEGEINFDATNQSVVVGGQKFTLNIKPFNTDGLVSVSVTDAKITMLDLSGDDVLLKGHSEKWGRDGEPVKIGRVQMSRLLSALIDGKDLNFKMSNAPGSATFAEKIEVKQATV